MKYILFIILSFISPFIMCALLGIGAHLMQWSPKQLGKLNKYKAGRIFAKMVSIIVSIIGLLILIFVSIAW